MENKKYEVDINEIQEWMTENKTTVHRRSVSSLKEHLEETPDNEIVKIIEFEWDGEIYASIYINMEDMPDAIESAESHFVLSELYEEAAEARDLNKKLKELIPAVQ
jgi:uncharacterized protein YjgD (DUF1641 family)